MVTGLLNVTTTTETPDSATKLANDAVRARLAASAHVVGPVAVAAWQMGDLFAGEQWTTTFVTTEERYADLENFLLDRHPEKNPQITAIVVAEAASAYRAGVRQATDWPGSV